MENIEKNASFYPKEHVNLLKSNPIHYEKYKDELEENERKKRSENSAFVVNLLFLHLNTPRRVHWPLLGLYHRF